MSSDAPTQPQSDHGVAQSGDALSQSSVLERGTPLRVAMILSGLGRVRRGAEAAFLELAKVWVERPGLRLTLFGSGTEGMPAEAVRHVVPCRPRERFEHWPCLPGFRTETYYEEFSYARQLARSRLYRPVDYDIVVHCTFPWVNWFLRRAGRKAPHPQLVYVTQNGDWPCHARQWEFRHFRCDGLVCTNPEYFERNRNAHRAVLIPNGVDPDRFHPAEPAASRSIPEVDGGDGPRPAADQGVVLIASAQEPSKRVPAAIEAVALVPGAFAVVAGDGSERKTVADLAARLLPGRHRLLGSVHRHRMPDLFRRADVFLHMSQTEPSALVYVEAASSGLPEVVHDSTLTRWTLADSALYADTGNLDQTAAAIRHALEPGCRASLGAAARRRVLEGWSWRHLAGQYEDFFRALHPASPRTPNQPA
jgi:glycosyltransferase involved in cell wall biosynthesis